MSSIAGTVAPGLSADAYIYHRLALGSQTSKAGAQPVGFANVNAKAEVRLLALARAQQSLYRLDPGTEQVPGVSQRGGTASVVAVTTGEVAPSSSPLSLAVTL